MKKRFKLFSTVAAMCLSLALLAFGVFAAVTVNYNIAGTVTYNVTDAFVKVTTEVKQGAYQFADDTAVLTAYAADTNLRAVDLNGAEDGTASAEFDSSDYVDGEEGVELQLSDLAFNALDDVNTAEDDKVLVYYFIVTVENVGERDVTVTLGTPVFGDGTKSAADYNLIVVAQDEVTVHGTASQEVAPVTTTTYTFAMALKDRTKSVGTELDFNFPVVIEAVQVNP